MDVKEFFFRGIYAEFRFAIISTEQGVFSGSHVLMDGARAMHLTNPWVAPEGTLLKPGDKVLVASGDPVTIARAEERLPGLIGKSSGVATSARSMVETARGRIKVVCGAWKKVLPETKDGLRQAIGVGGAGIRITESPFVYVDKNFVRMAGGIGEAVDRAAALPGRTVVVQLKGDYGPISHEAIEAVEAGAKIIMVDTGIIDHIRQVAGVVSNKRCKRDVKIGFGGSVTLDGLEAVITAGADIVDVGRAIIDAPILDFRLDVIKER